MKAVVSNQYSELLEGIEHYFHQSTTILHQARNEIRMVEYQGEKFVVKAFKQPNVVNKMAYALGKESKAKKSYMYAGKIHTFTPQAIGYIEFYHHGFMTQSYFISRYFEYDFSIRDALLNSNFPNRKRLFEAFAAFTKELHSHDILHHDYSPGNILIKQEGDDYIFKIVDINRMSFKRLSHQEKLQNFAKLWADDNDLSTIIYSYSKNKKDVSLAIAYSRRHKKRKNFKKKLKKILKR
jgi:serine/threonine protein kinase